MKRCIPRVFSFQDKNQSFWQLASIQSAQLGLPGIAIGALFVNKYGFGTTLLSIFCGNLVLWAVGLSVVSISVQDRINTIQIVNRYLGKISGIIASLVLLFSILNWYSIQINSAVFKLNSLLNFDRNNVLDMLIRTGAILGLITALISYGGIRFIKWIAIVLLPLFFIYTITVVINSSISIPVETAWELSPVVIISTVLLSLPGVINFPTFFRHSRSKADSFLALAIITIFVTFFQSASMWMFIAYPSELNLASQINIFLIVASVLFIILSLILVNLVNIYFASVAWENIFGPIEGSKEYVIIGLAGTLMFILFQIYQPMKF
nr:hypothetical protein [Chlamydiota bacterium]